MPRRRSRDDLIVEPVPGDPKRIVGGKLLDLIEGPWHALRAGGALPLHGNRHLLADHIAIAHLVAFFNPVAASLRRIEDVFESPRARQRFGLPCVPRSTLSDAQAVFDPALLVPILDALTQRLPTLPYDPRLDAVTRQLTAVDGTFFAMLPRVLWALHPKQDNKNVPVPRGQVRIDLHFDILHGTPEAAVVSGSSLSEHDSLARHVPPGRFYVLDRGFQAYALLRAIRDGPGDFVVRFRHDLAFDILADRPRSAEDRLAGVVADADIRIRGHRARVGLEVSAERTAPGCVDRGSGVGEGMCGEVVECQEGGCVGEGGDEVAAPSGEFLFFHSCGNHSSSRLTGVSSRFAKSCVR